MKCLITFIILIFTSLTFADTGADYHILKGKLHRGGKGHIEVMPDEENFIVKMNYEIWKKPLVPVDDDELKGQTTVVLPPQFKDERGYLELETLGSMTVPKAELKFIQRVKFRELEGAYQFLVIPNNGKSKVEAIYHPSLPSTGWGRVKIIFISKFPLLNGYQAVAEMN